MANTDDSYDVGKGRFDNLLNLGIGAAGGALGGLQQGMNSKRGFENSALMHQFQNPNAGLNAGINRNFRGNLLENIQRHASKFGSESLYNARGADGQPQLPMIYKLIMESLAGGGMNDDLIAGLQDMSTIPGLKAGNINNAMPEFKGPGFKDALLGAASGVLGALPGL